MVNFKFCILLKRNPFFVLSISEEDVKNIYNSYDESNVIGVICSDSNLSFKELRKEVVLCDPNTKFITNFNEEEEENELQLFKEITNNPDGLPSRPSDDSDRDDKNN